MVQSTTFYVHIALSMLSALAGLFHIVYCCLFYTSAIGIWNAAILVVTGFYGLCQYRPGCVFLVYSHALLFMAGLVVLSLNSVGLHCTHRSCTAEAWSRPIQQRCLEKFSDSPEMLQGMGRVHTAIHSLLIVESLVQMGLSLGVIWRHVFSFMNVVVVHLNEHYVHMLVAILLFSFGTVHTVYCSHLFYIGSGVWCPLIIIASSVFNNYVNSLTLPPPKPMDPGSSWALATGTAPSRKFSTDSDFSCQLRSKDMETRVSGAGGSTHETVIVDCVRDGKQAINRLWKGARALSALSIFAGFFLGAIGSLGAYCWHPVDSNAFPVQLADNVTYAPPPYSCLPPATDPTLYDKCYANLESYGFWDHESDPQFAGLARIQKAMTLLILMAGVASSLFAVYNEFNEFKRRVEAKTAPVVL